MYKKFKEDLLEKMVTQRDLIVIRFKNSSQSYESLFEVSTDNDKIYNRVLKEFENIALMQTERLVTDLCKKHNFEADDSHISSSFFDIEATIDGKKIYIDFKSSPTALRHFNGFQEYFENIYQQTSDQVYLVYLTKNNQTTMETVARQNQYVLKSSHPTSLKVFHFEDFLLELFGEKELDAFKEAMSTYKDEMHQAIGYQVLEIFNDDNLKKLKAEVDTELRETDYDSIKKDCFSRLHDKNHSFKDLFDTNFNKIKDTFLQGRYSLLLGNSDFATSFLTSEWLYKKYISLEEMDNTFTVSGYLKSIEQLLWDIIYLTARGRRIRDVEISEETTNEIDKTLGALQYFISNKSNKDLFSPIFGNHTNFVIHYISAQLSYWRENQRNGYFHKDILSDTKKISIIRRDTLFLYLLILGSLSLDETTLNQLK